MKIRTKLIISNILIVIIPLGVVFGLSSMFINGPGDRYWDTMENIYEDRNGVYSAQSILHTYKDQESLKNIKKEMTNAGYHFAIKKDGKEEYSNITDRDLEQAQSIVGELYGSESKYSVTKEEKTVIHETFVKHGTKYDVFAVSTSTSGGAEGNSYMSRYIALYIGFLLFILVVSVVVINLILTWWISRSILRPLKKLSYGSELIRSGYLDFEMKYSGKDEMGEVMSNFDEMRKHLKESVDERLQYEQYRKDLIIGVSHDLRTPLTSIKGYIEGLRDGIASSEQMKIEYYEAIETSIGSLEHLVSALTDFSKKDFANYELDLQKIELNEFYSKVVNQLMRKYAKDSVAVSFEGSQEKIYAKIDIAEMERVSTNIIENTLKYREKVTSNVIISIDQVDSNAVIKIVDDGPGVADSEIERIFECFYRADASRTCPEKGSGIGLAVVEQIVCGHGGTVRAENENGLAIYITIPISEGEEK